MTQGMSCLLGYLVFGANAVTVFCMQSVQSFHDRTLYRALLNNVFFENVVGLNIDLLTNK